VTLIAAVTETVDHVADKIIPGAFTRSLRERPRPKIVLDHDWNRPIGRVVSIKEYLPGDPRLPKRTGSGRPWRRAAGALIAEARLNTAITEGKNALEMIKFYGQEAAFSIGYRAVKSRQRGGVRELLDVDLFEISPVLFGAQDDARLIDVKRGRPLRLETNATTSAARAVAQRTARDRPGVPRVESCSVCRRPAAALIGGGLGTNESLICHECVAAMLDALDQRLVTITPEELDEAAELTTEAEYERALTDEMLWELQGDGSLTPDTGDPARGRAWGRPNLRSVDARRRG
jgi:phage head maturation protease